VAGRTSPPCLQEAGRPGQACRNFVETTIELCTSVGQKQIFYERIYILLREGKAGAKLPQSLPLFFLTAYIVSG